MTYYPSSDQHILLQNSQVSMSHVRLLDKIFSCAPTQWNCLYETQVKTQVSYYETVIKSIYSVVSNNKI